MRKSLAITFILALYALVSSRNIYGSWDSYARWNLNARLLLHYDPLALFQTLPHTHHDYPPLVYLVVSTGYHLAGDTPLVPIVIHGALLTLLMLPFRGAALLLVGLVGIEHAAMQIADLPLALVFLGAAIAYHKGKEDYTGAALGIGLLLKNEGFIIALAFFAVWIARERRIPRPALTTFLGFVLALWLFRWWMQFPGDLFTAGMAQRALEGSRYVVLAPLLASGMLTFGTGVLPLFLAVLALEWRRVPVSVPLLAAGIVLLAYVGTYAITPYDITWHVSTSFDRLIFHLFPVVVYEGLRLFE